MKNKIITIVGLLVLLVVLVYGYEAVFNRQIVESPVKEVVSDDDLLLTLDVKRQYEDGVYTFAGQLPVPTPCHGISAEVVAMENSAYAIEITTTMPKADVICAQVITQKDYKVSFESPENANVRAFVDGVEYRINNFDVPAGFDIDEFDLRIKG